MQINGLQAANAIFSPSRAANAKPAEPIQEVQSAAGAVDQLDLSAEAQQLMSTEGVNASIEGEVRMDRVTAIRQAIAEGTYETPERLSAALDRFLDAYA
jgi:negative regulator of flagellin synthesis FlgM